MSYTQFRNNYLTEAENRLAAVNISTATTNELLAAGALYKMAAAVAEADLIGPSALRLLEAMSGEQLQTWLQDAASREAFERILSSPEAMRAVAASSTAMAAVAANSQAMAAVAANSQAMAAVAANSQAMAAVLANSNAWAAVVASSQAMAAVAANSQAMAAVAASSQAMDAVWASNAAADAVLTSATAREAIYNSDTALARLQANPAQISRQIGISGRTVYASTGPNIFDFTTSRVILLRRWYSSNEYDHLVRRRSATAGSTGSGNSVLAPDGSGRALYGGWAYGSNSGTYTSNGNYVTADNDAANFVAACNGLRRDGWNQGYTLYVRYIVV